MSVENVPLPRPRPPFWPEPHSFAEAAGPGFDTTNVTSALSDCDQRLAEIADYRVAAEAHRPGRVRRPRYDQARMPCCFPTASVSRSGLQRSCAARWRNPLLPGCETRLPITSPRLGTRCAASIPYGSYECRGRNSVADAKLSEHGKGNAIDVRALVLAGGRHITSPMRPFQNRFAMICEIPPVIALRQCWDPALTATTMTISISTFSSEMRRPYLPMGCARAASPAG